MCVYTYIDHSLIYIYSVLADLAAGPIQYMGFVYVFLYIRIISISMERAYYLIESSKDNIIERVWDYVQSTRDHMYMYKTRLSAGTIVWVVEMPRDSLESMFLLQFSNYVSSITRPGYYVY